MEFGRLVNGKVRILRDLIDTFAHCVDFKWFIFVEFG